MPIIKNLLPITSLDDWEQRAGPKASYQWADGRSAKEAARAWLAGNGVYLPAEIQAVLEAHESFGHLTSWIAEPEAKLRFDRFPGEPRNSDLAVIVEDSLGRYLVAIEAKADETFGETVEEALAAALGRKDLNPHSNGIARIEQLLSALMPPNPGNLPVARSLRYQLFTATAGALCEAERRGFGRSVLLIHEFVSDKTNDERHRKNAEDLDAFAARISRGAIRCVQAGSLHGPIRLPRSPAIQSPPDLYLGKAVRNLRSAQ